MDKILIISDTHENHKLLEKVLIDNQNCKYLIHLGDEPDDLEYHCDLIANMQVFSVQGLFHHKWTCETACIKFKIKDIWFVIAHTPQDLILQEQNSIYCFGHTHNRHFEKNPNGVFLNPGHLKKETDRGEVAGYATLEVSNDLAFRFLDHTGKTVQTENHPLI